MKIVRPATWFGVGLLVAVAGGSALAFQQQSEPLSGVVNAVDVEARKIVVTPTGKEKTVNVVVNDQTEIVAEVSGKPLQIKDLKTGDGLGIVHTGGVASKIRVSIKPDELTGHVKSIGANLKTFVVTEIGTTTDITVAVTPVTSIATTDGKKMELKELKKGDGVGIAHVNSVATQILVKVRPLN